LGALTQLDANEVVSWVYEAPYGLYNVPPKERPRAAQELLHSGARALFDEDGLVAFFTVGTNAQVRGGAYPDGATDVGLGVRPELTGRGRGSKIVAVVVGALRSEGDSPLRVTIAAFNGRALRVWKKAGFSELGRFVRPRDDMCFILLTDQRRNP
jgi:GNAT superfamily N-acetyltransferase